MSFFVYSNQDVPVIWENPKIAWLPPGTWTKARPWARDMSRHLPEGT